jgi:hypothetical protein
LLATSLILQGYRTEAELSQLLGDIATDIRTDGVLNSSILGSALINDVKLFDLSKIRSNIESKYLSMGVTAVIPNFENYINQFIDSATYTFTNYITYPETGSHGWQNLLNQDTVYTAGYFFSFAANLPKGTSLTVKYDINTNAIAYGVGSEDGWISNLGFDTTWRTFESTRTGLIDLQAVAPTAGESVTIYFFENGSLTPTRIKTIHIL